MERFDVAVVGAGPAGSVAARVAAREGARTVLFDRREELGYPVQCGEFLPTPRELVDLFPDSADVARESYWIPTETVLRETDTMVCIAPSGRRYTFPLDGLCVARRAFDKALALRAEGMGAELRFPVGVVRVREDRLFLSDHTEIQARAIIGADGPLSTVARGVGFRVEHEMYRMVTGVAAGDFPSEIDLYFGRVAPGGYAWVFPKHEGANVGLGVAAIPRGRSLSALLARFAESRHLGALDGLVRWWVPIGPPPESAVRGRALFCGDSANLVMATNGGGIPTAMISGRDAGYAAANHVREGTPLALYDELWRRHLFTPLRRAHRVKRLGDQFARGDRWLSLGMRSIGATGLDEMMRLRWPAWIGGSS